MTEAEPIEELELVFPLAELDEFQAMCGEAGVEVDPVRSHVDNVVTVVSLAPLVIDIVKGAAVRVRGSRTRIAPLDRAMDRKLGGHVIFTNDQGLFDDGRTQELDYGIVRVVERRQEIDIDARATIVDPKSRMEFAKRIKVQLNSGLELAELRDAVITWAGVEGAELFRR